MQKARVRRIDKKLPLPEYKTPGAAGFDLSAREKIVIAPKSVSYIPLNVVIGIPKGFMVLLAARSSLHKRGLILANGVGIVDEDFCGNDDECRAAVYNFTDNPVIIERGERVVQGVLKTFERFEWIEVDEMGGPTRGGFGSTGV